MTIAATADVLAYLGKTSTATDEERALLAMLEPLVDGAIRDELKYDPVQATRIEFHPVSDEAEFDGEISLDKVGDKVVVDCGEGQEIIKVEHLPLRSITSIYEDISAYGGQGANDFAASTLLTQGTDYWMPTKKNGYSMTGFIRRINRGWPTRAGTVKVTYVSGFTQAELDASVVTPVDASPIRFAAVVAWAAAFQESRAWQGSGVGIGPLQSESISTSGHSVTYAVQSVMQNAGLTVALPSKSKQLLRKFKRYP